MKLAIATYKTEIAPCFEASKKFLVMEIEAGKIVRETELSCENNSPVARLRLVKNAGVDALLCNGIRSFYRDMLEAENIKVYRNLSGQIEDIVRNFLENKITDTCSGNKSAELPCKFDLEELIQMTYEYFSHHGYQVESSETEFPIDIISTYVCPKCRKTIRVAVCCSGHLFNWEKEIRELRSVSENYDATVYVHAPRERVAKTCHEYKINLLDPWMLENPAECDSATPIPALYLPVRGHDRIYQEYENN